MKMCNVHPLAALAVLCSLGIALHSEGQGRAAVTRPAASAHGVVGTDYAGPLNDLLKIRRLEGVGRAAVVRTPEYRSSIPGGVKPPQDWVEIKTTFDTDPEWIEELVFQYYVLVHNRKEEKAPYSLYQATVRYGDVERGRGHMSAMYIPPNAVKRYGFPVAVGVEISINGKVVENKSERDVSVRVGEEWWKNPTIVAREAVVTRQGCLLNRKESPFALLNIDDYEVVR